MWLGHSWRKWGFFVAAFCWYRNSSSKKLNHAYMDTQQGKGRPWLCTLVGNTRSHTGIFSRLPWCSYRKAVYLPSPSLSLHLIFLSLLPPWGKPDLFHLLGVPVTLIHPTPHTSLHGNTISLLLASIEKIEQEVYAPKLAKNVQRKLLELKTVCCAPGSSWVNVWGRNLL